MRITLSAIKADIGGIGGHTRPSEELVGTVRSFVGRKAKDLLIDYYVGYTGERYSYYHESYSQRR